MINKDEIKEIGKKMAIGAGIAGVGIIGFALGVKSSQKHGVNLIKAGVKTGAIQGFNIGVASGLKLRKEGAEKTKEYFVGTIDEQVDKWQEGFVDAVADELQEDKEIGFAKDLIVEPIGEGIKELINKVEEELE